MNEAKRSGETRRVEPIQPEEFVNAKTEQLPEVVLSTFNELITAHLNEGRAVIRQEDIVNRLEELGLNRDLIFANGYLNIEDVYREAGWVVQYEKPSYNETGSATFTFLSSK